MPRIQPVDAARTTGLTAELLTTTRRRFGGAPNMFLTAANAPAALDALLGLFESVGKSSLGHRVGEQIAIAVANGNGCGYCLAAHTAIGTMRGLDADSLRAARLGDAPNTKTAALLTLARAILDTRGHISDDTLATARDAGVSDAETIEVVAHIALNVFTNYLNSVSGTAIDFPDVPLATAA